MLNKILDRIEIRLAILGISAERASLGAGLSKDAIRNLKRAIGKSDRAGISTRTASGLAQSLQTNVAWLLDGTGDPDDMDIPSLTSVPLASWVSAGPWAETATVMPYDDLPTVTALALPEGEWVAFTVSGDSMDRVSPDGSVIFVNRCERTLQDNKLYVFVNDQGEATYKRFRNTGGHARFEPVSSNHAHQPIYPDGTIQIIGRVRRTIYDIP